MKIAFLGIKGVPGHHGVEVVVDSLIPHLVSLGHEITVYGYEGYAQPTDDYHGARVRTVTGSSRKNLEMVSHMWNASMVSRRERFDIAHIHSTDPCLLAWLPKTRFGVVATSHGQAYLRKKWGIAARTMSKLAERFFIYLPTASTCVSKPLCDYYRSTYRREVIYIPNGITVREAPDPHWLARWDLAPDRYLFCSAGRIERTKGLSTLLDAYRQAGTDLALVIAGGGAATDTAYFEELRRIAPQGVRFVGFLTGDEYFALYAHARAFVFPSEYEAMSMALLEGLSFGVPTIYSDTPENEAVANGLGFPFHVSDATSLAERLNDVLTHPAEARALGKKASAAVRTSHDWAAVARQYHGVYLKVAGR